MGRTFTRIGATASCGLLLLAARAQFFDDFNDQDLTNGPVWSGSSVFIANTGGQLQLNDVIASASYLQSDFVMPTLNDMEWRVQVQQSFAPSSSNYGRVYLVSDQLNLFANVNGYYLQFGEAGSLDAIELFQQSGANSTSVCRGPDAQIAASFTVGVQVKRDGAGNWTLAVDPDGGTEFVQVATGTDATWTSSAHLGVQCVYTASNADNFFYDDLYAGPTIVDATPPALVSVTAISSTALDLQFSEPVEQITAEEENNYGIIPFNSAAAVVRDATDFALVHLTLATAMVSGNTYTVTVNGVQDPAGNACANESEDVLYFVPDVAVAGDVVINEIMADPDPAVQLPEAEFIEIHNTTTNKTFDLTGWTLTDGSATGTLPTAVIPPGGFAILTDDGNAAAFTAFGPVIGFAGFPSSLTNTGEALSLKEPGGTTIDALTYSDQWYQDELKADGGWTLERIDPTTPCSSADNWAASNDPQGGTPGQQNSVFAIVPDITAPALIAVLVNSATELELVFSETMNAPSLLAGTYAFTPSLSVALVEVLSTTAARLTLSSPMVIGQSYTVTVSTVADCTGNTIGSGNSAGFALPEPVLPGDVVINEVLYDPAGSGSDLVELYNRSNKVLSLAGWKLANETDGVIGSALTITSAAVLLLPGEYIAVCEYAGNIATQYPLGHSDRYLEADMPSYNNGEGVVVLQDPLGDTLDRFAYDDDLHFLLLNSTDGVSLERVDPDRPTADRTNWQSAAETVGYATPGYRNSQYADSPAANGELTIAPAIFSPDNDGYQDILTMSYRLDQPGFTGTMTIFDVAGREVVQLMNNELLGTSGSVSWNGIMEGGALARMGPYVVVFEAFDLSGNVERFRETVVLAHKLN